LRLIVSDRALVDCNPAWQNWTEYTLGVHLVNDALAQDTDADGMPDAWETAHGLNPNDPRDAALDPDRDGQTNLEECLAGTDPSDPGSVLRITSLQREADDTRVIWTTVGGHHYQLLGGTNLVSGVKEAVSPLISVPPGGASTTNYLQPRGATQAESYYRVRLVP
jgi:hypothetical protein